MYWEALVEGTDVSAYGIARSLGRMGVNVAAMNEECGDYLHFSRYCRRRYTYPIDPTQPHAYAGDRLPNDEILCGLMLQWAKDVQSTPALYATSDWFARLLSQHAAQLKSTFRYHWISHDLFATIADKGRMAEVCERAGVTVPRTHISCASEPVPEQFPYPCIVKPLHRYTAAFPGPSKVFLAESRDKLMEFVESHPQLIGTTLIQEVVEGGDDQIFQCTALVKNSGEIGAYATVRKLRQYRPGYGSMCYGRTEPNDAIVQEAFKLLHALGYRGLGSLEFKYRPRDRKYYFIEMNTRLPWYNGVFADAGVNFAHLAYEDLMDVHGTQRPEQKQNVFWMSVRENRYWYVETEPRRGKMWEWIRSVVGANSYAWWNWRDPMPSLMAIWGLVRATVGKVTRVWTHRTQPVQG